MRAMVQAELSVAVADGRVVVEVGEFRMVLGADEAEGLGQRLQSAAEELGVSQEDPADSIPWARRRRKRKRLLKCEECGEPSFECDC